MPTAGLTVCIYKLLLQGHSPRHGSPGLKGELPHKPVLSAQAHAWTRTFIFLCLCTFQTPVYRGSSLTLGHNRSLAHKGESEGKRWCLACGPHCCQARLSVPGYLFESWQLALALVICPVLCVATMIPRTEHSWQACQPSHPILQMSKLRIRGITGLSQS